MAPLRYLADVATLSLTADACVGCGKCVEVCPHAVFIVEERVARIADLDACMECGACEGNCPAGAISVESGVGCAAGVIAGLLRGTEPTCDCGDDSASCCG